MIDPGMVRKLQKDLTDRMEKIREDLKTKTVDGKSGGGAVVVTANGNSEIVAIKISPEAIDPSDPEMLQDLIIAATNMALESAKAMNEESVSALTGGLHFPGLF